MTELTRVGEDLARIDADTKGAGLDYAGLKAFADRLQALEPVLQRFVARASAPPEGRMYGEKACAKIMALADLFKEVHPRVLAQLEEASVEQQAVVAARKAAEEEELRLADARRAAEAAKLLAAEAAARAAAEEKQAAAERHAAQVHAAAEAFRLEQEARVKAKEAEKARRLEEEQVRGGLTVTAFAV